MDISIDWLFFEYKYKTHNPKFNDRKAEIKLKTLVVIATDRTCSYIQLPYIQS